MLKLRNASVSGVGTRSPTQTIGVKRRAPTTRPCPTLSNNTLSSGLTGVTQKRVVNTSAPLDLERKETYFQNVVNSLFRAPGQHISSTQSDTYTHAIMRAHPDIIKKQFNSIRVVGANELIVVRILNMTVARAHALHRTTGQIRWINEEEAHDRNLTLNNHNYVHVVYRVFAKTQPTLQEPRSMFIMNATPSTTASDGNVSANEDFARVTPTDRNNDQTSTNVTTDVTNSDDLTAQLTSALQSMASMRPVVVSSGISGSNSNDASTTMTAATAHVSTSTMVSLSSTIQPLMAPGNANSTNGSATHESTMSIRRQREAVMDMKRHQLALIPGNFAVLQAKYAEAAEESLLSVEDRETYPFLVKEMVNPHG